MQKVVIVTSLLFWAFVNAAVQAQVEFPERFEEVNKTKVNLAGRVPLYSPTRCGHDELLFPGDQTDDWICDCAPTSIYHPETDACYPAFRKGPCDNANMLVLRPSKILPECVPNDCRVDGQIKIRDSCYTFGRSAPCPNAQLSYVLGVDPATLQVDCVRLSISLASRIDQDDGPTYDLSKIDQCARGTKRAMQGRCPER